MYILNTGGAVEVEKKVQRNWLKEYFNHSEATSKFGADCCSIPIWLFKYTKWKRDYSFSDKRLWNYELLAKDSNVSTIKGDLVSEWKLFDHTGIHCPKA